MKINSMKMIAPIFFLFLISTVGWPQSSPVPVQLEVFKPVRELSQQQGLLELQCEVTITSPSDGATNCGNTVTVEGFTSISNGSPPFTITCEVNGNPATFIDRSNFTATIPCSPGNNILIANCTVVDSGGNQSFCSDTIRVLCAVPPICEVQIASPQDSTVLCGDSVNVQGVAIVIGGVPPFTIMCDVNGVPANKSRNSLTRNKVGFRALITDFAATVPCSTGTNTLIATCTVIDSCGNQFVCRDTIRVICAGPPVCAVDITSPSDSSVTSEAQVEVTGITKVSGDAPPFIITCEVNGKAAGVSGNMFTATVPLVSGDNLLVATCTVTDSCGKQVVCRDSITVIREEAFLFGLDGDGDFLVKLDVSQSNPPVNFLGKIVSGTELIEDLEAMAWDPVQKRIIIITNEDGGPLFTIDPADIPNIPSEPPADIPAAFVGNTGSDEIEGITVNPISGVLYGVDNDSHMLLKINKNNALVTEIGELGFKDVEDIAFTLDSDTILYGADTRTGKLITIDTNSGAGTPVHPTNTIGFPDVEGLVFREDGTLFGYSNSTTHEFITIDPVSGIGTLFPTIGTENLDIEGLTFMKPDVLHSKGISMPNTLESAPSVPEIYTLEQNYPNPFNPETTIKFQLPKANQTVIKIYNVLGKEIRTLANDYYEAGYHRVRWDAKDSNGNQVASGIYFYQLKAGEFSAIKKMMLVR